jgi:group I intron endonuclease
MRILKSHPLLKLVNSYLIDASQPSNISYLWNFGSLLLLCLVIQIITGVTLAMHYTPNVLEAFNSIEHIMRDVNNGWLVRYLHSNTASAFFFLVYLHIGRGMYYGSYRAPRTLVWVIGTVIFILMIITAFLGYQHSPKWFNIKVYKSLDTRSFASLRAAKTQNTISPLRNINMVRYYSTKSDLPQANLSDKLTNIIKELELNPVYVFENLTLETTKKGILNSTSGLSGIYMIINKTTEDYYIGSAATNRFYARFSNHLIYFRGSKVVKAAVKKYGLDKFAFLILELYPNVVTKENNKELLDLEDKYLKLLLPNYNILTEAGSSFGYKHSEIDRIKMKEVYSDERRKMIGNLNRGKKFSPETIEKLRQKALNRPPMSDETKLKCVANTRPVILYNLNGTIYGEYPTILEASKAINCNEKTIRRALKTEKKLVKRQWIVKNLSK